MNWILNINYDNSLLKYKFSDINWLNLAKQWVYPCYAYDIAIRYTISNKIENILIHRYFNL